MQRIVNYGSFLQAYALKKIIEEMGNDVQFVDYIYEPPLNTVNEGKINCLKRKIALNYLPGKIFTIKCATQLKKDLKEIGVDDYNYHANVETLVIGSDEVFNCMQSYPVGYSRELFGKNYENKNIISYAASFGYTTLRDLHTFNVASEVSSMLSKFSSISVRDQNSYDIVESLTGKKAALHLDPVLIYDFESELKTKRNFSEAYIIVYAYTNRLNKCEKRYIKDFAQKHGLKIYCIGNYLEIADKNIICNPLDVFSYFSGANFIITDTFHGTIFSIKTKSKFCTIIRDSNRNKLTALLSHLEMDDRIVDSIDDIETLYNHEINYHRTNNILENEKEKTLQYLRENL